MPVTTSEAPAASPAIDFTEPHSQVMPSSEEYRKTGALPSKDDRARTEPLANEEEHPSGNEDDSASSESAAASEAASHTEEQQRRTEPGRRENRWQKRERELKELRAENARLKAQGTQPRSEPAQVSQPATPAPTTAAQPAAANAEPQIDDVDAKTGKPKFATWNDYLKAHAKWNREEAVREIEQRSATTRQQEQQQQVERTLAEGFAKKLEPTRAKYKDFEQVAFRPDLIIPKQSVVDTFLLDSDHAGEVLYYLGQHPEALDGFFNLASTLPDGKPSWFDPKTGKATWSNRLTPQRQFRKLMEIEAMFAENSGTRRRAAAAAAASEEQPGEGDEEEEDEQSGERSSGKPISQAPRPPHQTSGKGSVGKDPVVEAVETGDSQRYMDEVNRVALARRKKGKS